jgi:hypothetical protein
VKFASSREQAEALLARSCAAQGEMIEMEEAIELGKRIFGTLLHGSGHAVLDTESK